MCTWLDQAGPMSNGHVPGWCFFRRTTTTFCPATVCLCGNNATQLCNWILHDEQLSFFFWTVLSACVANSLPPPPFYHTQVASLAGKCTFLCRVRRLPTAFLYRIGWIVVTLPHVANVVKPKTTTKTTIRRKIEGIQQELLHSVLNACCETLYVDSSVFPVHISKGKTMLFIIQWLLEDGKNNCNLYIPYSLVNPIQSTSISSNNDMIITCSWSWVIASTSNILIVDTQRIFYLISLNTVTPRILRLHKLSGIVQRSVILHGFIWRTWRKWWRIAWEPVRLLSEVARLAMQVVVITWGCK